MKLCATCGQVKPFDSFGKHKIRKDGLRNVCKLCNSAAARKYAQDNRLMVNSKAQKWRAANRSIIKDWKVRNRDRLLNLENTRRARIASNGGRVKLEEWLEMKKACNYTCKNCGRSEPTIKLTQDHIKPISKGGKHTIDNIQPLCMQCNQRKYNND